MLVRALNFNFNSRISCLFLLHISPGKTSKQVTSPFSVLSSNYGFASLQLQEPRQGAPTHRTRSNILKPYSATALDSFWCEPDINYLHVEKWNSFHMSADWIWPKPESWSPNMRLQSQARDQFCMNFTSWWNSRKLNVHGQDLQASEGTIEMQPIYFIPSEAKCDL